MIQTFQQTLFIVFCLNEQLYSQQHLYSVLPLRSNAHYLPNLVTKELFYLYCLLNSTGLHTVGFFALSFTVTPLKDQIVRMLLRTRHVV